MALLPVPPSLLETLRYFDKYDYPLTKEELVYWASTTSALRSPLSDLGGGRGWYFLPGRQKIVILRRQREKISSNKWHIARAVGERLKKIPAILAVFVTGALAMNNCPVDDDIDLMIITAPNALWITRFWVNVVFWKLRRKPQASKAPDKICPNLWLDSNNLAIRTHNLYIAHEVLQTKLLWEKVPIQQMFLRQNSWVNKYLPVAYKKSVTNLKFKNSNLNSNFKLQILNWLCFILQYLYMAPKMTTEKVGLGYAFFHPKAT